MIVDPRGVAMNKIAAALTMDILKLLLGLVLLTGVATARRHHSGGPGSDRNGEMGDGRGPAWQARRNDFIKGTDLLDWSRDPRRVDPKVYTYERKSHSNCSGYGMHWTYSMTGQLEGQEWPAGLVKGGQLDPKSKAQLATCDGGRAKIEQDFPTEEIKRYLVDNDILLEREMPVEKCDQSDFCPRRGQNCSTYRIEDPTKAERINGPISGNLSGRVESLLRDYGPMTVLLSSNFRLTESGFLDVSKICHKVDENAILRGNFLLVGYGRTDDGVGYFKFKSSRGPNWGDGGFGYIKYTSHKEHCGHLYGWIELWKIKPCKRGRRAGHSRERSRHKNAS